MLAAGAREEAMRLERSLQVRNCLDTIWYFVYVCEGVCVGGGVLYLSAFFKNVTIVVDH